MARTPVVVFLSQDAVPQSPAFVAALAAALRDPTVAGAFARQRPRPDADPCTRRDILGWVSADASPRVIRLTDVRTFDALPPLERYRQAVFDNVASAVRRDELRAHPFAASRFGEDLEWGVRMLRLGRALAYVPAAIVEHSHRRTTRGVYRRNYLGHRLFYRLFGLRTIPDRPHLLRACFGTLRSDLETLLAGRAAARDLMRGPAAAIGSAYGQYRGACDEAAGRPYPAWA